MVISYLETSKAERYYPLGGYASSTALYVGQCFMRCPRARANDSALALLDELDDLRDLFGLRQFFLHRFDYLAGFVFRTVNQAERFFDKFHAFWWKLFAFQSQSD